MITGHTLMTSDAGDVHLIEKRVFGVWFFWRQNQRPVSPTCWDFRVERGIRIGSFVFSVRRTTRIHKNHPSQIMRTAL